MQAELAHAKRAAVDMADMRQTVCDLEKRMEAAEHAVTESNTAKDAIEMELKLVTTELRRVNEQQARIDDLLSDLKKDLQNGLEVQQARIDDLKHDMPSWLEKQQARIDDLKNGLKKDLQNGLERQQACFDDLQSGLEKQQARIDDLKNDQKSELAKLVIGMVADVPEDHGNNEKSKRQLSAKQKHRLTQAQQQRQENQLQQDAIRAELAKLDAMPGSS